MEQVFGRIDKVILDGVSGEGGAGGNGVVPYLPLNELRRPKPTSASEGTTQ